MSDVIDAHHHLWRYSAAEYDWIDDSMQPLRRDFLPADLQIEIARAGVTACIAVQARQTLEETRWLLDLAARHPFIAGAVGWAPLTAADFPQQLATLTQDRKLRGLRHVLQGEPDDRYMLRPDFNRGIAALQGTGLVYDILILERHLPIAAQFVDRHPQQVFVLDHLAKPKIRAGEISPWRENLHELARRPNVSCKLSGLVTEADRQHWTLRELWPWVEIAIEAFGPQRLLAGSDWPVCTMAASYEQWWHTLRELISPLSRAEQDAILGGNAARLYQLEGLH